MSSRSRWTPPQRSASRRRPPWSPRRAPVGPEYSAVWLAPPPCAAGLWDVGRWGRLSWRRCRGCRRRRRGRTWISTPDKSEAVHGNMTCESGVEEDGNVTDTYRLSMRSSGILYARGEADSRAGGGESAPNVVGRRRQHGRGVRNKLWVFEPSNTPLQLTPRNKLMPIFLCVSPTGSRRAHKDDPSRLMYHEPTPMTATPAAPTTQPKADSSATTTTAAHPPLSEQLGELRLHGRILGRKQHPRGPLV